MNKQLKFSEVLGFGGYPNGEFDIYVSAKGGTVKYDYFFADKQSKIDFIKGTSDANDALGVAEIVCKQEKLTVL